MASVALLVNGARAEAIRLAGDAVAWLDRQGHQARLLELPDGDRGARQVSQGKPSGAGLSSADLSSADLSGADLAVSLGGDGTFLRLVPLAYAADVPVLGVNFGRLGYLLEVEPDRFVEMLGRTLRGEVALEERTLLAVTVNGALTTVPGDDRSLSGDGRPGAPEGRWWVVLNEVVAEKAVPGHMVHLSTAVDGEPGLTYRADGVLVATPTGSTAYSLSAGGPVVAPGMRAMLLTPVAPQLAMDRSLVLAPEQVVTVGVLPPRPAVLVVDGREVGRLSPGAEIVCRVAPGALRVVSPRERGFAGMIRTALSPDRHG